MEKTIKLILLCMIVMLCEGCAVSAKNEYIKLNNAESIEYDGFNDIYCYNSLDSSISICSGSYRSKTLSIGLIVPIFPQFNRESRLSYDVKHRRIIEFKNINPKEIVYLSDLGDIKLCDGQYSDECIKQKIITILPLESVWLIIPAGPKHSLNVTCGTRKMKAILKEVTKIKWHLVSV